MRRLLERKQELRRRLDLLLMNPAHFELAECLVAQHFSCAVCNRLAELHCKTTQLKSVLLTPQFDASVAFDGCID